ncbi:MAG: hypothetical protein ACFBZ8_10010 [Opitutales bacterium]
MSTREASAETHFFRRAVAKSLEAARVNRIPALILWTIAGAILFAYYNLPAATAWLDRIAELKSELGYLFSVPSTAFFAGVLPLVFRRLTGQGAAERDLIHLPFFLGYWAYKGFEIDTFYRFQNWLFGDGTDALTITLKLLNDQIVYNGLVSGPFCILLYLWKNSGYSLRRTLESLGPRWYRTRVFPLLVATWFVWVPTVCVIYSLPPGLQLPVQNVILCFFVLLLTVMTREGENR